jgi:hypothetical protein
MAIKTYRYKVSVPSRTASSAGISATFVYSAAAIACTVDAEIEEEDKDSFDIVMARNGWEFVEEVV